MNSPLEDGKHAAVQYEVGTTEPWKGLSQANTIRLTSSPLPLDKQQHNIEMLPSNIQSMTIQLKTGKYGVQGQDSKSGSLLTCRGKKRLNRTEIAYHRIEEEFNKDKNDINSMQILFHLQPLTSAHQTKSLHWNLLLDTNHQ